MVFTITCTAVCIVAICYTVNATGLDNAIISGMTQLAYRLQDGATILLSKAGELIGNINFSKKAKISGKEGSTDKPSWIDRGMIDNTKSAEENAKRMLDNKYGKGNWGKGPGSEHNKIIKWITRHLNRNSVLFYDEYKEINKYYRSL